MYVRVTGTGKRPSVARQLQRVLAEPVLPAEHEEQHGSQPKHVSMCGPGSRYRRRLRADSARGDVRDHRAGERDGDHHKQPVSELLVQRQGEDEEADVAMEDGIHQAEVAPVEPEQERLPVGDRDAACHKDPGAGRDRQVGGQHGVTQPGAAGTASR